MASDPFDPSDPFEMHSDPFDPSLASFQLHYLNIMLAANCTTSKREKSAVKWALDVIHDLRESVGDLLNRLSHAEECPANEEMPDYLFTSGVQIGWSGRSLAVLDWEREHPCQCGKSDLERKLEILKGED